MFLLFVIFSCSNLVFLWLDKESFLAKIAFLNIVRVEMLIKTTGVVLVLHLLVQSPREVGEEGPVILHACRVLYR